MGGAEADKQQWWRAQWPNWWLRIGGTGLAIFGGQLLLAFIFGNEPGDESTLAKAIAALVFACVAGVGFFKWERARPTNATR